MAAGRPLIVQDGRDPSSFRIKEGGAHPARLGEREVARQEELGTDVLADQLVGAANAVGGRGVIRGIEATQDGCANDVTTPTMSQPSALRLVTPVFVSTNIGTSAVVPTFGALDLIYQAPEPGQVLLAGAAVGALILLGRSKRGS